MYKRQRAPPCLIPRLIEFIKLTFMAWQTLKDHCPETLLPTG